MMRKLRLVPAFLFFFLLAGQALLLPGQANAWCCGCGMCYWGWCTCPGYTDPGGGRCPYCGSEDGASNATTDSGTPGLTPVPAVLSSTFTESNVTQRVMELATGRKCLLDKLALSLLGNAGKGLKFEPIRFDEKNI